MDLQRPEPSIRSSCDRCRSSKLRCVPSSALDSSKPCQRCTRAKVTCVFGQRARKGTTRPRRLRSPASQESHQHAYDDETSCLSSSSSSSSSASNTMPCSPEISQSQSPAEGSLEFGHTMLPILDSSSISKDCSTTNTGMALSGFAESANEWGEDSWSIGSSMWADNTCGVVQALELIPEHITQTNTSSHNQLRFDELACHDLEGIPDLMQDRSLSGGGTSLPLELSTLLGEMHTYLHVLEAYHASDNRNSEDALNDYPIGDALYLLRRFCEIQDRVRESDEPAIWPQNSVDTDMVAATLVTVTCYITMTRVLNTLYGHLEQYLASTSPEPAAKSYMSTSGYYRGMRLKELAPFQSVCARAREATGALLSGLKSMDLVISIPRDQLGSSDGGMISDDGKSPSTEDCLTGALLKEGYISGKIQEERKILCEKIRKIERHFNRLGTHAKELGRQRMRHMSKIQPYPTPLNRRPVA
ncbi:hypothetical protein F4808DRAFT_430860 [Astrocystis sublimbata]|nr:hypothetical protein F4808DRAFT_430860 [Astrocystis sublimbata]